MFASLEALLAPAVMERLTLVINHVLGGEPVALERLKPHAGRSIRLHFERWPSLLPPPPAFAFRVTPAGMVEWCGADSTAEADLQLRVDASNPALLVATVLAGDTPAIELQGDAALAADVNWLIANLRWDVAADLERFLPPRVAHEVARFASAVARGLRAALRQAGELAGRFRPERA
jgi:ubiquinone biosynthesis protein UbiJ